MTLLFGRTDVPKPICPFSFLVVGGIKVRALLQENQPLGICDQYTSSSACAYAQSDMDMLWLCDGHRNLWCTVDIGIMQHVWPNKLLSTHVTNTQKVENCTAALIYTLLRNKISSITISKTVVFTLLLVFTEFAILVLTKCIGLCMIRGECWPLNYTLLNIICFLVISVCQATTTQTVQEDDIKKFECRYCAKLFNCQSYLDRHILQHTGEKPYRCKHCLRRFTRQTTVDKHVVLIHGLMNFQCEKCAEQFASRKEFTLHVEHCLGIRKTRIWL